MKYLKFHVFCLTLSDKLRKCIDDSIDIYVSKSSKVINLTSNRELQSHFIRILEIAQHMFDQFCYDSDRNVIVDDTDYYLNYFETLPLSKNYLTVNIFNCSMEKKLLVIKRVPRGVKHSELPWYERDGLMTYIDSLKSEEFVADTDNRFKKAKPINFNIIHHEVGVILSIRMIWINQYELNI